jgi:4-amino-4-deoxy-L-arabinose transferase-like glycosyltransferase
LEQHGGFWGYYLLLLPVLLLPHTGLLPAVLGRLRQSWAQPLPRFLWLWFLLVLGLFSFSQTQLPHYLLYGMTPLFILMAQAPAPHRGWLLGLLLLNLVWLGLPELIALLPPEDEYLRDSLRDAPAQFGTVYRSLVLVGLLVILALLLRPLSLRGWLLACGVHLVVLTQLVLPTVGEVLQAPVKQAGLQARSLPLPVVTWQAHLPSFSLYRQAITPQRMPQPGEVVFTRRENLTRLGAHQVIYAQGGVVLAQMLAPTP